MSFYRLTVTFSFIHLKVTRLYTFLINQIKRTGKPLDIFCRTPKKQKRQKKAVSDRKG